MSNLQLRIVCLFLILSFAACSTQNELPEVPTLQLSHTELFFDPSGGQKAIELKANGDWEASDFADWIELDNPITLINVYPETFIPSLQAQQAYADKIIAAKPDQQMSFKSNLKGVDFDSYRELRLIGEGNMGVKLDELISGKPYTEQEMTKSDGFIFSYDQTKFAITMDLQEKMVEEALKEADFPAQSLSYISLVSYGRIGLLIVETDNDLDDVKTIVRKKLHNTSTDFTEQELSILNEINVYHVYIDQSQSFVAKKGKAEIIAEYLARLTDNTSEVYPYKIIVSDYFSHANEACSFEYLLK